MSAGASGLVAVVGGGISGLAAALELKRRGRHVLLFEAAERVGGVIQTTQINGYRFEAGPNTVRCTQQEFREFLSELGLTHKVVTPNAAAAKRYLYFHSRLQLLPSTPGEFFKTGLLTPAQKVRVLLERFVRKGRLDHEETVAEFFGRRVGRGVTMTWIDIVVSGIFAGNPNRIGISSAFPELLAMEQKYGSVFRAMRERALERQNRGAPKPAMISFKGGLQTMVDRAAELLGGDVKRSCRVTRIERREQDGFRLHLEDAGESVLEVQQVLLALPADRAALLIDSFAPSASDLLFEVEYVNMVVAQAGFLKRELPNLPAGFGYLVPRCMRMRSLGWIFSSMIYPDLAPEGRIAMIGMLGGALDPHCLSLNDDKLAQVMLGELSLALGRRRVPKPEVFNVVRWKHAIPQYNVGHLQRTAAVRELLRQKAPGLAVAGSWVDGVSIEGCVLRGRAAARELNAVWRPS